VTVVVNCRCCQDCVIRTVQAPFFARPKQPGLSKLPAATRSEPRPADASGHNDIGPPSARRHLRKKCRVHGLFHVLLLQLQSVSVCIFAFLRHGIFDTCRNTLIHPHRWRRRFRPIYGLGIVQRCKIQEYFNYSCRSPALPYCWFGQSTYMT
jgi:hypothetical protein